MGKHYFFVVIFSGIILFNLDSYARGGSAPSAPAVTNIRGWNDAGQTPFKIKCDIPLSKLDYVGFKFEGKEICVDAHNDAQANNACSKVGANKKLRVINPGNPQYGPREAGNTRTTHKEGYYYCVPEKPENRKYHICNVLAPAKFQNYKFQWGKDGNGDPKRDDDCYCGGNGINAKLQICEDELPEYVSECKSMGLDEDLRALSELKWEDRAQMNCKCKVSGLYFPEVTAEELCKSADKKASEASKASGAQKVYTEPDPDLKKCVDVYLDLSNKCKTASDEAKKACDPKQNSDDKSNIDAINAANKVYTGTKTGAGMQQECFTASLVSNAGVGAIKMMNESCKTNIASCENKCSEKIADEYKSCIDTVEAKADESGVSLDNNPYNGKYVNENFDKMAENFQQGIATCTGTKPGDAKAGEISLSGMLEGVGKALSSSVQCMCKLSSGGGDCNAIPTVANCNANPGSPGCGVYGSIAVCTPGSGYDAKLCNCQLNPKEAGCPGGGLSGGLSNFASPSIKNNGIGDGGNPTTIANGLKNSGAFPDLPRATDDDSSGSGLTLGASPSGGPGGGVGGGGVGGGGASGGGEPPAAAGELAEEKGFGGLFNQAKTFFKDTLGGRKTPTAATKNGKSEKGFDPNKLRPTRGLASKNGIGSKNQDIWKMSNSCMYAETCPRNMNSFLEAPLKQK